MRRRRTHQGNHERWMVSYADFVTLLFAFFVVLYSSAQIDKARLAKLSTAISQGFSGLGVGNGRTASPSAIPEAAAPTTIFLSAESAELIRARIESELSEELRRRTVSVREVPDGLVLSLRDVGFFDSGAAELRASSMESFDRIGQLLASIASALRVEGHTDNVPIHNSQFHSNWELSTARATEIVRLLLVRQHIGPERLSAAGYGEFHPIAGNDTEDGRRQNRRVDIVILAPHEHPVPPDTAPKSSRP